MSKRVDLFVIGAHKAGTTALCELLGAHPRVTLSAPKEPNYFTRPEGRPLSAYLEGFHGAPDTVWVDGSTNYSKAAMVGDTAPAIAAHNPDAKIVYLVRDPLARIASAWVQLRSQRRADIPADFNEAVRDLPHVFIDPTLYERQLALYRRRFDAGQIQVHLFEDYARDPRPIVHHVLAHVGLEPAPLPDDYRRPRNASAGKVAEREGVKKLRRSPVGRALPLLKRLPGASAALSRARGMLVRPIEPPTWHPDVRRWALTQVRDDARALLDRLGVDAPWQLDA